jgi:L-aminopeptidase/D-esterase-like protein
VGGLTDVAGLLVGHAADLVGLTGCTAVLCPAGAVGAVEVRGGASGLLGLDLLDPGHIATRVHGVVLAGGSAFGLEACFGVMAHLEARGVGLPTTGGLVPLVLGAILYDLAVGASTARPDRAMGARAAAQASSDPVAEGSVGAGVGASVGKAFGLARAMKGGLGTASRQVGGATVAALVAVNAFGDVRDPVSGALLAGARDAPDGRRLVDTAQHLREGRITPGFRETHTTIGLVATDAALDGAEARRVAALAHLGLAAALSPPHLSVDGDALFCLATGSLARADAPAADALGLAAADSVAEAIVRAIRTATPLGGLSAWRDLFAARAGAPEAPGRRPHDRRPRRDGGAVSREAGGPPP